jgi:hypothetical protein
MGGCGRLGRFCVFWWFRGRVCGFWMGCLGDVGVHIGLWVVCELRSGFGGDGAFVETGRLSRYVINFDGFIVFPLWLWAMRR